MTSNNKPWLETGGANPEWKIGRWPRARLADCEQHIDHHQQGIAFCDASSGRCRGAISGHGSWVVPGWSLRHRHPWVLLSACG